MANFPISGGHPDYAGTYIPTIFAGKTVAKFYAASVLAAISSTEYESEISKYGDKVVIRTVPDITISDYSMGQSLTVERPTSGTVELLIDKGKYFNFVLDDVAKFQSDLNLQDMFATDASEKMKIVIDTQVLANIHANVDTANKGASAGAISGNINLGATTTPVLVDKTNVIDHIINLGLVLDEANIPETGRWCVIPAWMAANLKKSDLKNASITGDSQSVMRNGRLGEIDRFTIYSSNNLPNATVSGTKEFNAFAGVKEGLAFASQLTNVETLRAESTFGTLMRGLNVYGFEVVKDDAIASLVCYRG